MSLRGTSSPLSLRGTKCRSNLGGGRGNMQRTFTPHPPPPRLPRFSLSTFARNDIERRHCGRFSSSVIARSVMTKQSQGRKGNMQRTFATPVHPTEIAALCSQ